MPLHRAARPVLPLLLLGVLAGACAGADALAGPVDGGAPVTYQGVVTDVHLGVGGSGRLGLEPLDGGGGQRTWTLAPDARAAVLECAAACETVAVPIAALAEGRALPHGGSDAVFDVVVEGGVVVSVAEHEHGAAPDRSPAPRE